MNIFRTFTHKYTPALCMALILAGCGGEDNDTPGDAGADARSDAPVGEDAGESEAPSPLEDAGAHSDAGDRTDAGDETHAGAEDAAQTVEDGGAEPIGLALGECEFTIEGVKYTWDSKDFVGDQQPYMDRDDELQSFGVNCVNNDGATVRSLSLSATGITGTGTFEANMGGAGGVVQYSEQPIQGGGIDQKRDLFGWTLTLTMLTDSEAAGSITSSVSEGYSFHVRKKP